MGSVRDLNALVDCPKDRLITSSRPATRLPKPRRMFTSSHVGKITVECAKGRAIGALGKGTMQKGFSRLPILPLGLVWVAFASVAAR